MICQPVVEGVGLALPPLVPAQVDHPPRMGRGPAQDHVGGLVGAGVIHHVDPQPVRGIFEAEEAVDGRPDDGALVPRRDHHRDTGEKEAAGVEMVMPAV